MTKAAKRRHEWFRLGAEALRRVSPKLSAAGAPLLYACPLCLRLFAETALATRDLTFEDVPPKSLGGRRMLLTCRRCNNEAGRDLDSHAHRAEVMRALNVDHVLPTTLARVTLRDGPWVVADVTLDGSGGRIVVREAGARKGNIEALQAELKRSTEIDGTPDIRIDLRFPRLTHDPRRARASWLRAAYLAAFASWGHRLIVNANYERIRQQIRTPLSEDLEPFVFVSPMPERWGLIAVLEPDPHAGLFVMMGRRFVQLPWPDDQNFWTRLHARVGEPSMVTLRGKIAPWPRKPVLALDAADPRAALAPHRTGT